MPLELIANAASPTTVGRSLGRPWPMKKHQVANVALATSLFIAAIPSPGRFNTDLANWIWIAGAVLMGVFCLVRSAPQTSATNVSSLVATAGMIVAPFLMVRTASSTIGLVKGGALAFELLGVALIQVSRLYMGRSFGLLPANRGIVTSGPFAMVRHPIYLGWLLLSVGYVFTYPAVRNVVAILVSVPFMIWRIEQEEALLENDLVYAAYHKRVPCRLIPGLI
jgi:protein-S-isoprenylcysteine O-methyltransferase Ste14